MPKLNRTHILSRLTNRLEQLEAGEVVPAKEILSLLTPKQQQELKNAWEEQQKLRKGKRARTVTHEKEMGWKSKREVRIEIFKKAIQAAWNDIENDFDQLRCDSERRQMRIYFDTLTTELKSGKDKQSAANYANLALTRAGLRRIDGAMIGVRGLTLRDREIRAMEDAILQNAEREMDCFKREQIELLREHEKAVLEKRKKLGG